jgi:hypothetical protein
VALETVAPPSPVVITTSRFYLQNLLWCLLDRGTHSHMQGHTVHLYPETADGTARVRMSGLPDLEALSPLPSPGEGALLAFLGARLEVCAADKEMVITFIDRHAQDTDADPDD